MIILKQSILVQSGDLVVTGSVQIMRYAIGARNTHPLVAPFTNMV